MVAALLVAASALAAAQTRIERSRLRTNRKYAGIARIRQYDIRSAQIPAAFDGFRMAFATDIHYRSRFDDRELQALGLALADLAPDALLLGGDYQEGCEFVRPLFETLALCAPPYGTFAVMGNNDYERCTQLITSTIDSLGMHLLDNDTRLIEKDGTHITIAGAHNTFGSVETTPSPTNALPDSDFVVLLTHTPDYAEDVDIRHTDVALAGHLHGGQVTLLGLYAPILPSHHGQRFRTGLRRNSAGIPIIISNGLGTSRRKIRFCAPTEIIVVVLHHTN